MKRWIRAMSDTAIWAGVALGAGGVLLSYLGNPTNSGICVSCFMENVAGALQLHDQVRMSYIRPEIIGFVLGSFIVALSTGRFNVKGGSSPITRFFTGFFIIVGCAVFIGCPIKMFLRLSAGDLTAVGATIGLVFGIWIGVRYIKGGMALPSPKPMTKAQGYFVPALALILLLLLLLKPSFIHIGQTGPAAAHAPIPIALGLSLIIGGLSQRSGLCITGGIRNYVLARDKTLLNGVIAAVVVALVCNLLFGHFKIGMAGQPSSHLNHLWSFLAMTLVGIGSVIIDGCPFRQLVKAGQGDLDAGMASLGMLAGAAMVYVWMLRSTSDGPTFQGKIAVLAGLIFTVATSMSARKRRSAA